MVISRTGKFAAALALVSLLWLALPVSLRQTAQAQVRDPIVVLETTRGRIVMRIFESVVPYTADNFLDLVDEGFYDGLTFHRVENWVIQGGDPNGNGSGCYVDRNTGRPRYLKLEANPNLSHNSAGVVAMARSANSLNSASCQFYILKAPMPTLNGKYAVFGKVFQGMNTVYAICPGDRIISARIVMSNGNHATPGGQQAPGQGSPPGPTGDPGF